MIGTASALEGFHRFLNNRIGLIDELNPALFPRISELAQRLDSRTNSLFPLSRLFLGCPSLALLLTQWL